MNGILKVVMGFGIVLVLVGFTGRFFGSSDISLRDNYTVNDSASSYRVNGMMYRHVEKATGEKLTIEVVKDKVNDYISIYGESLEIGDIIAFEENDYYVSIIEKSTGLGAIELLVNPYSGEVYPKFGSNMMWNQKYGMHRGDIGYDMMSGNGMMGGGMMGRNGMMSNRYAADNQAVIGDSITMEEAHKFAEQEPAFEGYAIPDDGLQFYGYYTFKIEENNEVIGVLSVNEFTGEVWY